MVLLDGFLLAPLVVGALAVQRSDVSPKLMLLNVLASVLWLVALEATVRRPFLLHLALAPFYVVVGTDLFLLLTYETRLTATMLSVIFENLSNAWDYFQATYRSVLLALAGVATVYGVGLWKVRGLRWQPPRFLAAGAWAALAALYVATYLYTGTPRHTAAADRSTPFGVLPQSYLAYLVYADVLAHAERTRDFHFGARRDEAPPPGPETYLLVLGESSRRDHWGLYGYERPTTPRLAGRPNLVVFRDVVSQASFTKASVPLLLTRASAAEPGPLSTEKSIVSALDEAGFHTAWLSTQARDPFTGAINRYSGEAKDQRFFERQRDEALVEAVKAVLASPAPSGRRFIVVHTMGSHFSTTNRYPREFATFPDAPGAGVSEHQALLNSYDDSILYTDFVLDALVGALQSQGGLAALLYLSDHGENLRDDSRGLFGHFYSNEYDLPVPMLLWYSDAWAARSPAKLAAARRAAAELKLDTRVVFHSLLDLAGVTVGDPRTPRLSVFSAEARPGARLVMTEQAAFDYDRYLEEARAGTASR